MKTLIIVAALTLVGCNNIPETKMADNKTDTSCESRYQAKNKSTELSCKLSSPELKERKATVLTSLRKKVIEKKELANGYAFRFEGSDKTLDELFEFIKTERECCDFFTFNLSISGDKSEAWLELTGVDGAKDFVTNELRL
jgi:hypothetical protein